MRLKIPAARPASFTNRNHTMKNLIIVGLFVTNTLLAAQGTCSWTTFIRPVSCSGFYHGGAGSNAPITFLSAADLPETYYMSTNQIQGLVFTPRSINPDGYTTISEGTLVCSNEPSKASVEWVNVTRLWFDATCCQHTNTRLALEFKDIAEFSGGLYSTNDTKVETTEVFLYQNNNGRDDIHLQIVHEVDDGSTRYNRVEIIWPGQGRFCPIPENRLKQYYFWSSSNKVLQIRGTTNQANTTVIVYTNAVLNTNWLQATPVSLDANGEADVDVTAWALPTNGVFFNLNYTNNP